MHLSQCDILRGLTRSPLDPTKDVRRLRTRAWLGYAYTQSQCSSWPEFDKTYVARGRTRSNLGEKWRKGSAEPTRYSVAKIDELLPGTLAVFESPLWLLLENRPFSKFEVKRVMCEYRPDTASGLPFFWLFPGDEERWKQRRCAPTLSIYSTDGLVRRGDTWGFVALLWTVRYAEADGDQLLHHVAAESMYRAMPMAIREPWLSDHADELIELTETIRARYPYSFYLFDIDFDVIKRQAADPTYEPVRELRHRDPVTGCFEAVEDPVLPAHVIPGDKWAEMERARAQAMNQKHSGSATTTPAINWSVTIAQNHQTSGD